MRRILSSFVSTGLAFLFLSGATDAAAQGASPPLVYVVTVTGEKVDAARLRAAVERELSVTAVAPDDPRASSAAGSVTVESSAPRKTLTVTVRKVQAPVTRTVALPDDPARAEVAAVFLAGNLARDEAKELLGAMRAPSEAESERPSATPAPAAIATPAATRPGEAQADEELRRLRIILRDNGDAVRRRGRAFLYGSLSYAALAVPGGIFLIANNPSPSERWGAGSFLIGSGAGLVVASLTNVVVTSDPDIVLEKKAKELEVEGGSSAEILARVDAAWEAQARDARSSRRSGAIFSIVFGSLAGAVGTTLELTLERRSDWNTLSPLLFGIGAADIGLGLYSLLVESPFETAHRTWKKARVPAPAAATVVRPSVAFAPLAGGGAISLGFAF